MHSMPKNEQGRQAMQRHFHSQHRVDELIQNLNQTHLTGNDENPKLSELERLLLEKVRFNFHLSRRELGFFEVEEIILSPMN